MDACRWPMLLCLLALTPVARASDAELPGFDDFRRVDRLRRLTGQIQTAELLAVTQISSERLVATARAHAADWELHWGAAELTGQPALKDEFFQSALALSQTNQVIVLRYAAWLARQRADAEALRWLALSRRADGDNVVSWLVELWLGYQQHGLPGDPVKEPPGDLARTTTLWRDHAAAAAQARIRMLERMGYTPYAARRLGFTPDLTPTEMAQSLAQYPIADSAKLLLSLIARAMQDSPTFLLTELVGQSLELAALRSGVTAERPASRFRAVELERRRNEIRELLAVVERQAIEIATERELVAYYDELLLAGEERALRALFSRVRGPLAPSPGQ